MLEEQLNSLSNEYKGLARENENLNKTLIQREQIIENIKAKCDQCEIDLKDLNEYNQKIRKERNGLQKNLQVFVDENKAASEHIRILENDLNEFNNKNQGLKVQIENLEKYNEELQKQIEDFHREKENEQTEDKHYISSLNNKNMLLESQIELLQKKVEDLNMKNQKKLNYQNMIDNYENLINVEKEKNNNANNMINSLRKEIKFLKEENSKLTNKNMQLNMNCNNTSSEEDNVYLKELITDLHNQIGSLSTELNNVKYDKNDNPSIITTNTAVISTIAILIPPLC